LLLGSFIALMNETLLNVAFPQLMSDLNVPIGSVQWLATAYMLVVGVLVPVVAFLLKSFTTRSLYVTAMGLFTVGTVFCAFCHSFPALLASRMVQAVGTALMFPIMLDAIVEIFPPARRGTAIGASMMVVVLAPGIGPTLAGIVLAHFDWHYLFLLTIPLAVLATLLGIAFLKNVAMITKPRIDIPSILLSFIGFGGLILGVCSIEECGLMNAQVLASVLSGVTGIYLFVQRQLSIEQPLLEVRALKHPQFALGVSMIFIAFMMTFALNIILPVFAQRALGMSTVAAGLLLLPGSIVNGVTSPIAGKLHDRYGAKPLVMAGFSILVVTMFGLANITTTTPLGTLIALQIGMMLGDVLIFSPMQAYSLNQLPRKLGVHGISIISTAQQIAAAFGSSLFIGLMGAVEMRNLYNTPFPDQIQKQMAIVSGTNMAFGAATAVSLAGLALSIFLISKDKPLCVEHNDAVEYEVSGNSSST